MIKGVDYTLLPLLFPTLDNEPEIKRIAKMIFDIINNFKIQNIMRNIANLL